MNNNEKSEDIRYNWSDFTLFVPNYGGANRSVNFRTYTSDNSYSFDPIEQTLLYKRIFEFARMVEGRKIHRETGIPRKIARKWTIKEKGKLA